MGRHHFNSRRYFNFNLNIHLFKLCTSKPIDWHSAINHEIQNAVDGQLKRLQLDIQHRRTARTAINQKWPIRKSKMNLSKMKGKKREKGSEDDDECEEECEEDEDGDEDEE
jgi:hypothetical protein